MNLHELYGYFYVIFLYAVKMEMGANERVRKQKKNRESKEESEEKNRSKNQTENTLLSDSNYLSPD